MLICGVGCWEVRLFAGSCEVGRDEVSVRTSVGEASLGDC